MKPGVTLSEKGLRAMVALCHHVSTHGSFSREGKAIARIMLEVADAAETSRAWCTLEAGDPHRGLSVKRMREALEALRNPQAPAPRDPKGGA